MEPHFVSKDGFFIMGVQNRITPAQADYRNIWEKQFAPRENEIRSFTTDSGYYSAYFASDEPGKVDFIAGMAVREPQTVPEGLISRMIPASQYAMFTCRMDQIGATWSYIYGTWLLEAAEFEENPEGTCFEYFSQDAGMGCNRVSVYIPIREKQGLNPGE